MNIWNDSGKRRESVSYMAEEITHICRKIGRRSPGSASERAAAEYFARVLQKKCGCTDVKTESFEEHPDSFYGYFYFSAFCDVLCCLLFFSKPLLSILFGVLGFLLFIFHFVLYRKPIDPLFPKKQGTNVTAVRPCAGEVRQRIFLNGHTDAAWEFPINYRLGGIAFEIPGLAATVGVFYYIVLSFRSLCGVNVHTAGLRGLVFLPFFLLLTITYNPLRVVDGANDNLTGCLMGVTLLKEMEEQGIRLENTEIGVILTGYLSYSDNGSSQLGLTLLNIGIIMYAACVLFYLVTLPVELDASRRALKILKNDGLLAGAEMGGARKVLSAAAMTYIASAASALVMLLRLIAISKRRD